MNGHHLVEAFAAANAFVFDFSARYKHRYILFRPTWLDFLAICRNVREVSDASAAQRRVKIPFRAVAQLGRAPGSGRTNTQSEDSFSHR
jgi:hypothetical protein